jgi:hypothetical protein
MKVVTTTKSDESIRNSTAKLLQEKYFRDSCIEIALFLDITFKEAKLRGCSDKRKYSDRSGIHIERDPDEDWLVKESNPEGVQRKLLHNCAFELVRRSKEIANCKIHCFKDEINNNGPQSGGTDNFISTKTAQSASSR